MVTSTNSYLIVTKPTTLSRISAVVCRAPLFMMTVVFTLISFRYLSDTVGAAAAVGIKLASPGGITTARVGFGAFPLALAILAFASLISPRWRLPGLYMVLTIDSLVMAVKACSIITVHSSASARLFAPEAVLFILSLFAIRLQSEALQPAVTECGLR
jgi:hypothetical protein